MIRVLLAKMGLDCHDTAVVALAQALRDDGMEVIYLGLHNSAEKIAAAAEQDDVDVIGLSFLSGQQLPQTRKLVDARKASDCASGCETAKIGSSPVHSLRGSRLP